jgi:hypothetical protein
MVHGQFGKVSHAGYFLAKTARANKTLHKSTSDGLGSHDLAQNPPF